MAKKVKNKGWRVTFSGTGINLALGILYTWSVFKVAIKQSIESKSVGCFTWDLAQLNDPYVIALLAFAFSMILAGKCQDKFGPRITAFIGGILVGLGFLLISQTTSYGLWIVGFGLLVGTGIGFGYSSATPPALKWFPPEKTGLIAGLVVAGFGLASVWTAPVSKYLLNIWGLQNAMLFFGIAFLIVVCLLSLLLVNPPAGYVPKSKAKSGKAAVAASATAGQMLKTPAFYQIWFIYFIGAGVGLMVISSIAGMATKCMGELAFVAVAILAIGNAGGRVVAGLLSDKIGRKATLIIMLSFQVILMLIAILVVEAEQPITALVVVLAALIGFNYGTNLSLFPALTKDKWGLKNFGVNYGIVFTAWGVGGFVLSRISQMLFASTGKYMYSFLMAAALLVVGIILTMTLKTKKAKA
jgi:OFA family oxalate/formate antiporter-like MFS transporter